MFLDWALGPVYSIGPNIPTIAPRNSLLLLFGQKGGFQYCHNHSVLTIHHLCLHRCLFSCPSMLLMLQPLRCVFIKFLRLYVPHILQRNADPTVEDFVGTRVGIFLFVTVFLI